MPRCADGPPVAFLSWTPAPGRARDIATALGGEGVGIHPRLLGRRLPVPLRYALSLVLTAEYLVHRRPGAVVVTNPPVWPALLAWGWCRATGRRLLLDSHPSSFGAKGSRYGRAMLPMHRWLTPRVAGTLVTTRSWADMVDGWGGRGVVAHEPPAGWLHPAVTGPLRDRPRVLFVGVYASDEPIEAVLEAARLVPEVDLRVTGDLRRCPAALVEQAPENTTFLGWLDPVAYRDALLDADVVLALTTEPTSVLRAAYEAVYACRPLVTSDWPVLHELFPSAVHVGSTAEQIAAGLRAAVADLPRLRRLAAPAQAAQTARWQCQLEEISACLGVEPARTPTLQEAMS